MSQAPASEWRVSRVRLPKTAEVVAQVLRRQIATGQLQENDALPPESELLKHFGVSRQTIREALRILESERLLTIRRGAAGGPRVCAPSRNTAAKVASLVLEYEGADLADVYQALGLIDGLAIAQLAGRRGKVDLRGLRAELDACAAALDEGDRLAFSRAILSAEDLLVELTGNVTLSLFHSMAASVIKAAALDASRLDYDPLPELREARLNYHAIRDIVDRIEAGDAEGAGAIWRRHSGRARKALLNARVSHSLLELMEQAEGR